MASRRPVPRREPRAVQGLLFLGVGAVYFRTHSLDITTWALWKKMPLTFLFTLIAALGITGVRFSTAS